MESAYHETEHDEMLAQQAARDAIMEIPAFPELLTRLTRVFGPGAERDMIHQLVYWFSKPKMQNRWWAYKTAEEWRDERGLNRKQVNKARARLKPRGVLEEKYGNYKRLHYRLDWVKLAELLSIPLKGGQSYEWDDLEDDDFFGEPLEPLKGGQSSWSDTPKGGSIVIDTPQMDDTPDTYAENSPNGGGQTNAREYAGEYLQDNSLLQRAAEPAKAEPAAPEINKDFQEQEQVAAQAGNNKRHSQDAETPSETTPIGEVVSPTQPKRLTPVEVSELVNFMLTDKTARAIGLTHLEEPSGVWPLEEIASYVCRHLDKAEEDYTERYVARLPEALEELRLEASIEGAEVA